MKTILKYSTAVILMGFLANFIFGGGANEKADLPALIKDGARVIDVRTPAEFAGGHITGALNIPLNIISREINRVEPDQTKPIIVYCHSGMRSASAKKDLERMGYTVVINGGSFHHMKKQLNP